MFSTSGAVIWVENMGFEVSVIAKLMGKTCHYMVAAASRTFFLVNFQICLWAPPTDIVKLC
jgi:hypothetical protein